MRDAVHPSRASWRELGFLTAWAVAGLVASALVAVYVPSDGLPTFDKDQIVDRGLHNLTGETCRTAYEALLEQVRGDPQVLWMWVEESVPGNGVRAVSSAAASVSRAAPRPLAFTPASAPAPETTCAFPTNSLHALSVGGVARPSRGEPLDPWSAAGGP